jgi:hypothetical protein
MHCDLKFFESQLAEHVKNHHQTIELIKKPRTLQFECDICKQVYTTRGWLQNHIMKSHIEPPFVMVQTFEKVPQYVLE